VATKAQRAKTRLNLAINHTGLASHLLADAGQVRNARTAERLTRELTELLSKINGSPAGRGGGGER